MPKPSAARGRSRHRGDDDRPSPSRAREAEPSGNAVLSAASEGRLVVGLQPVREAVRAHGSRVQAVFVADQRAADAGRLQALARFARDHGVPLVQTVSLPELDRAAAGSMHQGVAAVAPALSFVEPATLIADASLLAIALDGIQDPQNFGAVVRSAVAIADAAVVWAEHGSAPLSLATFRASAGAIEHARLCRVPSLSAFLQDAASAGVHVVGLDAHAEHPLRDISLTGPAVLVIGSEHRGMRRSTRRACRELARILGPSKIDSLNASVAAAVTLYEAANQRRISNT